MTISELESIFRKICREKPEHVYLEKLVEYPDRRLLVDFLLDKCREILVLSETTKEWDGDLEWGIINSVPILCEINLEASIETLLDLLESVDDNADAIIHNTIMISLEGAGQVALEPVMQRYNRSLEECRDSSTWLWLLSTLGVNDPRIYAGLLEHIHKDLSEAIGMIGTYGDKAYLPFVEEYVKCLAKYLNDNRIDPFAYGLRFDEPFVNDYIEARDAQVMLEEADKRQKSGRDFSLIDKKVAALDRKLLKYADLDAHEKRMAELDDTFKALEAGEIDTDEFIARSLDSDNGAGSTRVGRNDPCPCGSGKKYKKCCGKT